MLKCLLAPAALLYKEGVTFRHRLFDWGVLKSEKFDIPVVCIGNITVGGTGKTPLAEMIVDYMSQTHRVALLSRGYGRRTKGYREVAATDHYRDVGDEPLQIKRKFPDVCVVVCERRADGIRRIRTEHPEVDLIVMDDGFQHRYVEARINVVVMDYTRPFYKDDFLPCGTLRDKVDSLYRAHYFIVTKCSEAMSPLEQRLWRKELQKVAYQKVYFTRMVPTEALPVTASATAPLREGDEVIAMSGIGNPKVFVAGVRERYKVVDALNFADHHVYSVADIKRMVELLEKHPAARLLTTEKDAVKLRRSRRVPDAVREKLYFQPVKVEFMEGSDDDFLGTLKNDIEGRVHVGDTPMSFDA